MIQIRRSDEPGLLQTSTAQDRYSQPEVVRALWKMQHGKCCYCEQKIPRTGHGKTIEHFRPRHRYDALTNAWHNLLLACPACNGKKSDKFPCAQDNTPLLIDPSDPAVDPETELQFIVDHMAADFCSVRARGASQKGRRTRDVIGLAGSEHIRRRRKYVKKIFLAYLDLLAEDTDEGNQLTQQQKREHFESLLAANNEFAALTRECARAWKLENHFGVLIPAGPE